MASVDEILVKDEKVLIKAEQSIIALIPGGIITILLLLVGASSSIGVGLALALVYVLIFYRVTLIAYFTNTLVITNKRIFGSTGLIRKQELDMPINKVNAINMKKTLFGAILGYYTLTVTSMGEGWTFPLVKNAKEIRSIFYEQQQ